MGQSIYIDMKDGSTRDFPHTGRAGGSYTNTIKYVEGFVIITDAWDNDTAIPSADIKEIKVKPHA